MANSDTDLDQFALKWVSRLIGLPVSIRKVVLFALAVRCPAGAATAKDLLSARGRPHSILDRPLESVLAGEGGDGQAELEFEVVERIGSRLGAWRIVSLIGMGGMGAVYLAKRDDGAYQRDVALKCMRGKLESDVAVSAFHTERNALAKLNHRDIVPILDGGVEDDGCPWFVMPLLSGVKIDDWCDERSLGVRQRVELLIKVCDAVSHAHEKAILHLDIKPSSVLVNSDGQPKLLDFGIAEVAEPNLVPSGLRSPRVFAFSPGFSAPELMRGEIPTASSDVYSLGSLMYFLLCARTPLGSSALQSQLAIASGKASIPPSALARRSDPSVYSVRACGTAWQLGEHLVGDLDAIALHSVELNPEARYSSVVELREDLARWMERRPISLRDGLRYKAGRFMARHPLRLSAAILLVLMMALLGGTALWQRREALREIEVSTRAEQIFSQSLAAAALTPRAVEPVGSAALLSRTEANFRRYAHKDENAVLARGLSSLARSQTDAGNYDAAQRLARESAVLAGDQKLQFAFNQVTLARLHNLRARYDLAIQAVEVGRERLGFVFTHQERLARLQLDTQLAIALYGSGDGARALRVLNESVVESEALRSPSGELVLAQMLIIRGNWYRQRLMIEASERDLNRAISLARKSDFRIVDDAREVLVRTMRSSRSPSGEKQALKVANELLESRLETLGERHPQTGVAWVELASMQMLAQDNPGANESVDRADSILSSTLGVNHPAYAKVLVARSHLLIFQSKLEQAVALTEKARGILERHHGSSHELTLDVRFLLANEYWWMARQNESFMGKAVNEMREAIALYQRRNGEVPALHRMAYAEMLQRVGDKAGSEREIAIAEKDALRQYGSNSEELLSARCARWEIIADRTGFTSERSEELDGLIESAESVDSLYSRSILFSLLMTKAEWLAKAGKADGARKTAMDAQGIAKQVGIPAWIARAAEVASRVGASQD